MSAVVAIDFDGTLCVPYDGPPLPGALEFLEQLSRRGYYVAIYTCNVTDKVEAWLEKYGVAKFVGSVTNTKPPAVLYFDDRGWRFDGEESYGDVLRALDVDRAAPWWERDDFKRVGGAKPVWEEWYGSA